MSYPLGAVKDVDAAVYRILKEREPLSVPEIVEVLHGDQDLNIELSLDVDHRRVRSSLKQLVRDGHVTHDPSVDAGGNVKWRTTARPDLNPKPDGREIAKREIGLDAG